MAVFQERKNTEFKIPMDIKAKEEIIGEGVRVVKVAEDQSPFKYIYDPGHPNANEEGYVAMPNVNIVREMTDMITASRAYEANTTVITTAKGMANTALGIGK